MLWLIAVVLLVLWLGGFFLNVVGDAIHLLLVLAVAVVIWNFVKGRARRAT